MPIQLPVSAAPSRRGARPLLVSVVMVALIASILPGGVSGQSPDPAAEPAPSVQPAPAADETPATTPAPAITPTSDPASDGPQARTTRFPFSWVSPTKAPPTTNLVTAGGVKSIRFSLRGDRGLDILAEGYPRSQRYDCRTGALIRGSQYLARPFGAAGLRYDASSRTYRFGWQTREEWSNQCRVFQLRLTDGTTHRVRFRIQPFHFRPPTRALNATNRAVAGSTVSVRFRMGTSVKDIFRDRLQPRSARIDCTTGQRLGSWSRTSPRGLAGLKRNRTTRVYRYAWRTSASWAGTCRRFEMTLKDGTVEALRFRFGRAPVAVDDAGPGFGTDQDTPFTTGNVLANDSDPDGDPISVSGVSTAGTDGTVASNGDGTFDYDPEGAFDFLGSGEEGSDTFAYTLGDGLGGTDQATVTITIDGLNDAPTIGGQTRSVSEAASDGDPVGSALAFGDPDSTDDHTFAITAGNTGGAFAIDDSGRITVADSSELDSAATPSYALTVEVTDDGSPVLSDSATITVNVTDVNDAPVISGGPFSIDENPSDGDVVGTLSVTDPDSGQGHTFSIQGGNTGGAFAIDAASGQITVADADDVDHETNPSFALQVRVTDDGAPALHDDTTVTITVNDVNEAPVVAPGSRSVAEDGPNGTSVGSPVTFTDPDSGQSHTFSIEGGNTGGAFAIDPSTGQITVADATELDFEADPSYSLTVRVTDDGSPVESGEATITVELTNVNEAPVNTVPSTFAALPATDVPLTGISIADPDAGGADVELTLGVGDGTLHVRTDVASGVTAGDISGNDTATVTVTASIAAINATLGHATGLVYHVDAAPAGSDTLTVTTDDLGNNGSGGAQADTDTASITFNEPPVITSTAPTTATEDVLYTYAASSSDGDGPGATWSVTGSDTCGGTIDPVTGVYTFTPAGPVPVSSCVVAVQVCDGGTPNECASQATPVAVTAVNGPPIATNLSAPETYIEDTSLDLVDIVVSDADNATVTAMLTLSDPAAGGLSTATSGSVTSTYVAGTGVWTASGAIADVNTLLAGVVFTPTANSSPSFVIATSVSDGVGAPVTGTKVVTGIAEDDAPTSTAPASIGGVEDTGITFTAGNSLTVADADGSPLTVVLTASNGTLTMGILAGLTFAVGDGTAETTMTFSGAQSALNTALATLTHAPTADFSGASTVSFSVSDGVAAPVVKVVSLTLTAEADIVADSVTTLEDTPITFNAVTGTNDASADSFENAGRAVTSVTQGTIGSVGFLADGSLTYTPNPNANGPDSFTYTVTSGGVTETATVSVTVTPVNDAPDDADESFAVQSNVGITVAAPGLLTGATDVESDPIAMQDGGPGDSVGTFTTTQGGSITIAADGSFTFTPQAGDASLADTFLYTVSDGPGATSTSTVTFNVNGDTIWFVQLDAATNGTGTVSSPFNTLAALDNGGPDANGSTIFLYTSTGTGGPATLADDLDLQASQLLVGQGATRGAGATINTYRGFTTQPNSLTLPPINGASDPTISVPAVNINAITLGTGNTLEGFDIGSRPAAGANAAAGILGSGFGTLSIWDVDITGAGQTLGLQTGTIQAVGGGTVTFTTLSSTGTSGAGLSLDGIVGSISAGGAISGATGATVSINAGTVSLAYSGNLTQANNAALVSVTGGHTTGTLSFTGTLSATNGTGLQFNNADSTTSYTFSGATTLNGGDAGIDITGGSAGTFSFGGATITNPTGVALNVDGATGTISISGAMSKTSAGRLVDFNAYDAATATVSGNLSCTTSCTGIEVTNDGASSGTVTFSGAAKTLTTGAITAVDLDNNDAGTVNFTGGNLDITTTSGGGFSASNGGTVTVQGTSNDITSTTGTALNVSGTAIGGAGLTFKSISSTNAASGIVLDNTGTAAGNGGLTVTGDGTAANNGSGGVIQSSTGPGINLASTKAVSLNQLNVQNSGDDGIRGLDVAGFSLTRGNVTTNGNAVGERGIEMTNLTGSGGIANSTISGSSEHNVIITNDTPMALTAFNVTATTIATTNFTTGDDGFQVLNNGAGSMTVSVTGSTFTDNKGDHFQAASDADASGPMNITFNNNTLTTTAAHDNNDANMVIGGGITINTSGTVDITFQISNNTLNEAFDDGINFNLDPGSQAGASMIGTVSGNTIGTSGDPDSGSESSNTITIAAKGQGTLDIDVLNNNIFEWTNAFGILLQNSEGSATLIAKVTGNTLHATFPQPLPLNGIHLNAGATAADNGYTELVLTGNDVTGEGNPAALDADIRLRQRFSTTVELPGYGGANNDSAAVSAFVAANNDPPGATLAPSVSSINNVGGGGGGFIGGTPTP